MVIKSTMFPAAIYQFSKSKFRFCEKISENLKKDNDFLQKNAILLKFVTFEVIKIQSRGF